MGLDPQRLWAKGQWYDEALRPSMHLLCHLQDVQQNPQGLRHEWVAVLLLTELRSWLLPAVGGSETDFAISEWAIAGHHPAHNHDSPRRSCPPGAGAEMRVHTDHADFAAHSRLVEGAI